jgi:hypothetical protein
MMTSRIATIAVACSIAVSAAAQTQRTFVSAATGSDANLCSRNQPCRNFAAAIAQTLGQGEVIVLDSGGYGAASITQPMSINAPPGVYAGITTFSGNAVQIAIGANDRVSISGLTLNNLQPAGVGAPNGVLFSAGGVVDLDRLTINAYQTAVLQQVGTLTMSHSVTRGVIGFFLYGVLVSAGTALVQDSILLTHGEAFYVNGATAMATAVRVTAKDSFSRGFRVLDGTLVIIDSVATNGGEGLLAGCGAGVAYVSGSSFVANGSYGIRNCSATVYTLGNNTIQGNGLSDVTGGLSSAALQ